MAEDPSICRALMSCLNSHIVMLDATGTILAVNDAWVRFAQENGARFMPRIGPGANYLDVCRRAAAKCEYAAHALPAIERVISGSQRRVHARVPVPLT